MRISVLSSKQDEHHEETIRLVREVVSELGVMAEIEERDELPRSCEVTMSNPSSDALWVDGSAIELTPECAESRSTPSAIAKSPASATDTARIRYETIRKALERAAWQE